MIHIRYMLQDLKQLKELDEDQGPLVMHIDPATFAVIADKTVLASDAFG